MKAGQLNRSFTTNEGHTIHEVLMIALIDVAQLFSNIATIHLQTQPSEPPQDMEFAWL